MIKFFRWFFTYIWILFASFLSVLICLIRPFHPNNTKLAGSLIGKLPRRFMNLDIIYLNKDKFQSIQSSLIISNHQTDLDLITFGADVPDRTVVIGKKEIRYIPFFGQLFALGGNIFIDRSNRKKALASLNKAADKIKSDQLNIWIMPEGTRSKGRGLLPFKKGVFHMSTYSGVPIYPVIVSQYNCLDLNKWRTGKVVIKALDPIYPNNKTAEELLELTQNIMKKALIEVDRIAQS